MGGSDASQAELTVLNQEPLVAGIPLASMDSRVTPTRLFFVRNHFPVPNLDISGWSLTVEGEVNSRRTFKLDELRSLPSKELECLMECAGNSRASVQPPIEGLLWDHGGVGTARWRGVPLCTILEKAGLKDTAREVVLEGADRGHEYGANGEISFAMSLPLEKAMDPETMLAYEINGEPLTPEHGYPVRAVVPGWYGMVSVKWLKNIRVLNIPFNGFHKSDYYVFIDEGAQNGLPREPVAALRVKSLITWPRRGQVISTGTHRIRGMSWSGGGPVTGVEVSTDDGRSWRHARFLGTGSRYAWRQWEYQWEATQPGYYLVRARATDSEGNTQPAQARWNYRGFGNNAIHAVPVEVRFRWR